MTAFFKSSHVLTATLASLVASSTAAMAHSGAEHVSGLSHGFMHPLTGYDHVLAMFAVGLLAARIGGKGLWAVPAAFMSFMLLGAGLGFAGVNVPYVEYGIVASIFVLAGLCLIGTRLPLAAAASIAAFFAVFHGHAHGMEVPVNAVGAEFALGFLASTALLHVGGLVIGVLLGLSPNTASEKVSRS